MALRAESFKQSIVVKHSRRDVPAAVQKQPDSGFNEVFDLVRRGSVTHAEQALDVEIAEQHARELAGCLPWVRQGKDEAASWKRRTCSTTPGGT